MSRYIDPSNMSPEDVVYVMTRPTLLREFQMQGLGDPTVEDYEGHDFDWSTYFDEKGQLRPEPLETESEEARAAREAAEAQDAADKAALEAKQKADEERAEAERAEAERLAAEAAEAAAEGEDELPAEKQWNEDMTKAQLDAVIAARNADYDDDEQIGKPEKDNKQSRIDLLVQDDKELAGDEDEEQGKE